MSAWLPVHFPPLSASAAITTTDGRTDEASAQPLSLSGTVLGGREEVCCAVWRCCLSSSLSPLAAVSDPLEEVRRRLGLGRTRKGIRHTRTRI